MYQIFSLAAQTALVATTSLSGHASAQAAAYTVQPEPPAQAPAASAEAQQPADGTTGSASGAGSVPSSYLSCVRFRESANGAASSDQFGITPSSWSAYGFPGSPYTAPYGEQVAAFQRIYQAVGTSAWSPYDGC